MAEHRVFDRKRSRKPYMTVGVDGKMVYHFTIHVFNTRDKLIPHILKANAHPPV
jgi:hypothetical protein